MRYEKAMLDSTLLKRILILGLIIGLLYIVVNYSGAIEQKVGVKGASTKKTNEISAEINSNIKDQVSIAEKQALNLKISDIMNGFSGLSKIPKDFNSIDGYLKQQVSNMLKSRK